MELQGKEKLVTLALGHQEREGGGGGGATRVNRGFTTYQVTKIKYDCVIG